MLDQRLDKVRCRCPGFGSLFLGINFSVCPWCAGSKKKSQWGDFFLDLIFLQYVKGKRFRTVPVKKLSARFVWSWFCRRVDIPRLGTQILYPAFLAKHPLRSKQLSGRQKVDRERRWYPNNFNICPCCIQIQQKMISRKVNFDRVSLLLRLINFVHFGWCLFYRGFIYQGWGRRLYFLLVL